VVARLAETGGASMPLLKAGASEWAVQDFARCGGAGDRGAALISRGGEARPYRPAVERFANSISVLKSIISAAAKGEPVPSLMKKQIADELSIGEVTIKMHRSSNM
jgi:hypothetical protein